MSRTHRDTRMAKAKKAMKRWLKDPRRHAPPPKEAAAVDWMGSYPHWWDTMFHHKPARAREKELLHKVRQGEDVDGHWPDHRKPHLYYW